MACVEVPALPLQLVLQKHPQWRHEPLVILAEERPTAPVLWANRAAQRQRIERGLPFTHAKSLSATLRAQVVPQSHIEAAVNELFELLSHYSPSIEPIVDLPGIFFLDPTGLSGLFGTPDIWARQAQQTLNKAQYQARIAVGFSRPMLYVICQVLHPQAIHISPNVEHERSKALQIQLHKLHLSPKALNEMASLGLQTISDLLALPHASLRLRYGDELANLHDFLGGTQWTPLQPRSPSAPLQAQLEVDPPDAEISRLLFGIKNLLHNLLQRAHERCEAVHAIHIQWTYEYTTRDNHSTDSHDHPLRIEASAPTLDPVQLIDLIRLRLSTITLAAPVCEIALVAESVRVHPKQLHLQHAQHRRDLAAANRSLSRIKAQFGEAAVTTARLRDAHLPEARFVYEPCKDVLLPHPSFLAHRMPLVRRIHRPAKSLSPMPTHNPQAWLAAEGDVHCMLGPYRIAGGWWAKPRERDYYFVETKLGDILWVFYDRPRRRWFLHGLVR